MDKLRCPEDIKVTPEMIEAGERALLDEVVDGYIIEAFAPDVVTRVFMAMWKAKRPSYRNRSSQ
jgi:hypothetical protein